MKVVLVVDTLNDRHAREAKKKEKEAEEAPPAKRRTRTKGRTMAVVGPWLFPW